MRDSRPVRRSSLGLDQPSVGLYVALAATLLLIGAFGSAPLALATGLVALLVVD